MISNKRGFTLIELLVVVGMIAVILGAISTSVTAAQNRARIQKATSDVKVTTQAILAYEQWAKQNGKSLPKMTRAVADSGSLSFLIGKGESAQSGGTIPVMLMAAFQSGGKMLDPWGTPYRVTIKEGKMPSLGSMSLSTGYYLPNAYRLGAGEREL